MHGDRRKAAARKRVFLSHSSADHQFVDRLASDLERVNADVWYDRWEIRVGDSLIEKISSGIDDSDYLVVVLSATSVESDWVKRELNAALMRELEEKQVAVLPVKLADCRIPALIREKRYADFSESYEAGFSDLLVALFPECETQVLRRRDFRTVQYLITGLAATDDHGSNSLNCAQLLRAYPFREVLRGYLGPEETRLFFWSTVAYRSANPDTPFFVGSTAPAWGLVSHTSDEDRARWVIDGITGRLAEELLPYYPWATGLQPDRGGETLMRALLARTRELTGAGMQHVPTLSTDGYRLLYRIFAIHAPDFFRDVFITHLKANPAKVPFVLEASASLPDPPNEGFYAQHCGDASLNSAIAAEAMAKSGNPAAVRFLRSQCRSLTRKPKSEELDRAFRSFGRATFVPELTAWLAEDPPVDMRVRLLTACVNAGTIDAERILDAHGEAAAERSGASLASSIRLVGRLHANEGIEAIEPHLQSTNPIVCEASIYALRRLVGGAASARLMEFFDSQSSVVVAAALDAWARSGVPGSIGTIARFAAHSDTVVSSAFYRAIQWLRPGEFRELFEPGLKHNSLLVRIVAARSFSRLADLRLLEHVVDDLQFDGFVRSAFDEAAYCREPFIPVWLERPNAFDERAARLPARLTNFDSDEIPFCANLDLDRMVAEVVMRR